MNDSKKPLLDVELANARARVEELEKLQLAELLKEDDAYSERMHDFLAKGGRKLVDQLVPEHTRTSCSDDLRLNGWYSAEYGPRCIRCALLEVIDGGWPRGYRLNISIQQVKEVIEATGGQ